MRDNYVLGLVWAVTMKWKLLLWENSFNSLRGILLGWNRISNLTILATQTLELLRPVNVHFSLNLFQRNLELVGQLVFFLFEIALLVFLVSVLTEFTGFGTKILDFRIALNRRLFKFFTRLRQVLCFADQLIAWILNMGLLRFLLILERRLPLDFNPLDAFLIA